MEETMKPEKISDKERELIELYRKANASDKEAIRYLLNKYRRRVIYLRREVNGT